MIAATTGNSCPCADGTLLTMVRQVAIEASQRFHAYTMKSACLDELLIGVLLAMFGVTGCKDAKWTPSGSADLILAEIKLGGGSNVAKRIDADESFGRAVLNGI